MAEKQYPFRQSEYLGPLRNETFWVQQALAGEIEAHLFLYELEDAGIDSSLFFLKPVDIMPIEISGHPNFSKHYAGKVTDQQYLRTELTRVQTSIEEFQAQERR